MLYATLPASRALEGMLIPRGAAKNSGKMVTTLMRRALGAGPWAFGAGLAPASSPPISYRPSPTDGSVIQQTCRRIDRDHARVTVDVGDDAIEGNEDRLVARGALDVQRQALRKLICAVDDADVVAGGEDDAHAGQVMDVDLIVAERFELCGGKEQIPFAPGIGDGAIVDLIEVHDEAALEWADRADREGLAVFRGIARGVARK